MAMQVLRLDRALTCTCEGKRLSQKHRVLVITHATSKKDTNNTTVTYGRDWYSQTRDAMNSRTSTREQLERYKKANREANNGREREDLYTDNWDGDVYKGGKVNILSVLIAVSILAPIAGLVFALQTYGTLWG